MSELPTKHSNYSSWTLSEDEGPTPEDSVGDAKGTSDFNEQQGKNPTRFMDTGTRIPGNQKARNDTYMEKLKRR